MEVLRKECFMNLIEEAKETKSQSPYRLSSLERVLLAFVAVLAIVLFLWFSLISFGLIDPAFLNPREMFSPLGAESVSESIRQ